MCDLPANPRHGWRIAAVTLLSLASVAFGNALDEIKPLLENGRYREAITLLEKETESNPAHEAARIWLAESYAKAGEPEKAIKAWEHLMVLSQSETNLRRARRALSHLRRRSMDDSDRFKSSTTRGRQDPFHIPMPKVDWEGLDVVEDAQYRPPILPAPYDFEVPPFAHETEHFTVYSTNERLSAVIGERAEIYLDFMTEKLFGGRSWAVRFPIVVYQTYEDYVRHGAPAGTGGVTMRHITGSTEFILLFQLKPVALIQPDGRRSGRSGLGVWKYGIESVLPHELTHAVINEFFAGRPAPQWLHEAIAGRFEQTREHYAEAARLARRVAVGEFFRLRDLFNQKGYPERIALFYEQSAAVVLYLFETGAETMHVFLTELAEGNGHDAACAAALGIPEVNAVEEFERRWVQWMKALYVGDLQDRTARESFATASRSKHPVFRPWVNEVATATEIASWRTISLDSLDAFAGIGDSKDQWSADGGILRCKPRSGTGPTMLALRMNEIPPAILKCTVKCTAAPGVKTRWFGLAQLDAQLNDTRVEVIAPFRDISTHEVMCIWTDDLAVYVDGKCVGRFPAFHVSGNAPDVDYPLALVADGPFEIRNLQVAAIRKFSETPVVVESQDDDRTKRRRGRRSSDPRRSRGRKSRP